MNVSANASPVDVAMEFVKAINRQDANGLMQWMTVDHQFTDSLGNIARGREGMREGWKLYFQMVPDYRLNIEETYAQGSCVVMLGVAGGTYSHSFEGVEETGMRLLEIASKSAKRWETPAAVRARIHEGKVAEWRIYADNEPLRKLMRVEPDVPFDSRLSN